VARYQAEGLYYLDEEEDDADWKSHALRFGKAEGRKDSMAYNPEASDYVVVDPLLEKGKGKWSDASQREKKRGTAWEAGKSSRHLA